MDKKVILKKPHRSTLRVGHPWIYRSQIKEVSGQPAAGDLVGIFSESKRVLGRGYFNPHSEITVRFLTRQKESIDKAFFQTRIERALILRRRFVKDTNAFRLVSSEADGLPGLVIDQYGEILVLQFLTLGMDKLKPLVVEALEETLHPKGIFERSDSNSRKIEGLETKTGWLLQNCGDEIVVFERDIRYRLRFGEGQKTGLYLDQRENRLLLKDCGVKGEVLDAFCYSGGFGLHLAASGAVVLGIDSQKDAIKQAEENRSLNQIPAERLTFRLGNVFDELKALEKEKWCFDLVVLDPPSFVKKKAALEAAMTGTKEIILRSMKLLKKEGLLAVFSCSYHVDENLLMQATLSAAADAHKSLKVLKFLKQSADHPIDPFIPETYYLKGFLLSVSSA